MILYMFHIPIYDSYFKLAFTGDTFKLLEENSKTWLKTVLVLDICSHEEFNREIMDNKKVQPMFKNTTLIVLGIYHISCQKYNLKERNSC